MIELDGLGCVTRRSPYEYATTWPLEEVVVVRPDGSRLRLLLKLCGDAREARAYGLLQSERLGTPRCYGAGKGWLALEKVGGAELWQRGDIEAWEATARWARRLHDRFRGRAALTNGLPRHDRHFYAQWLERAMTIGGPQVAALRPAAEAAIECLIELAPTLVHGELYPSNVLIAGRRVAAVDWETAAIGPGAIDLAALVTGWDSAAKRRIAAAYADGNAVALAAAQLMLALRFVGMRRDWTAPPAHRRDWLAEAAHAAEELACGS